jgi:hypothetical protein
MLMIQCWEGKEELVKVVEEERQTGKQQRRC